MSLVIIGIDPDAKGGIALRGFTGDGLGRSFHVYPFPMIGKEIDMVRLPTYLLHPQGGYEVRCYCEWPSGSPPIKKHAGMIQATRERRGVIKGAIEMLCVLRGISLYRVTPGKWKRRLGLLGADKGTSINLCQRLFPDLSLVPDGARKPRHGLAEAALIAEYGWQHYRGLTR